MKTLKDKVKNATKRSYIRTKANITPAEQTETQNNTQQNPQQNAESYTQDKKDVAIQEINTTANTQNEKPYIAEAKLNNPNEAIKKATCKSEEALKAIRAEIETLKNDINKEISHLNTMTITQLEINNAIRQEAREAQDKTQELINLEINNLNTCLNAENYNLQVDLKLTREALENEIIAIQNHVENKEKETSETLTFFDKALRNHGEEQSYLLNRINKIQTSTDSLKDKLDTINRDTEYMQTDYKAEITQLKNQLAEQANINNEIKLKLKTFETFNNAITEIKELKNQVSYLLNDLTKTKNELNEKITNAKHLITFYKTKSLWGIIKMKFQK